MQGHDHLNLLVTCQYVPIELEFITLAGRMCLRSARLRRNAASDAASRTTVLLMANSCIRAASVGIRDCAG